MRMGTRDADLTERRPSRLAATIAATLSEQPLAWKSDQNHAETARTLRRDSAPFLWRFVHGQIKQVHSCYFYWRWSRLHSGTDWWPCVWLLPPRPRSTRLQWADVRGRTRTGVVQYIHRATDLWRIPPQENTNTAVKSASTSTSTPTAQTPYF